MHHGLGQVTEEKPKIKTVASPAQFFCERRKACLLRSSGDPRVKTMEPTQPARPLPALAFFCLSGPQFPLLSMRGRSTGFSGLRRVTPSEPSPVQRPHCPSTPRGQTAGFWAPETVFGEVTGAPRWPHWEPRLWADILAFPRALSAPPPQLRTLLHPDRLQLPLCASERVLPSTPPLPRVR